MSKFKKHHIINKQNIKKKLYILLPIQIKINIILIKENK